MLQHTYSVFEEREFVDSWCGGEDMLVSEESVEGFGSVGVDGETFGYFLGSWGREEEVVRLEDFEA